VSPGADTPPANNDQGLVEALRELGLLGQTERATCFPLSGGVSSDVFCLRGEDGRASVVKRSIPRLRVQADWRAPIDRDAGEVNWLRTVRAIDPRLTPEVLAWAPDKHLFVMRWLDPVTYPVWKQEMAAGRVDPGFAAQVGMALARIHSTALNRDDILETFPTDLCFRALRVDPFFLYTAERHPDVARRLRALADDLLRRKTTLIWGDASPKNILVGPDGPVLLDAETAVIGDAAFDLAFCLAHLLLKTVWLAPHAKTLMASLEAMRDAYLDGVDFEPRDPFSIRSAALVGAVLLARVDGKSPAGYLDAAGEDLVRRRAKSILTRPDLDLHSLPRFWSGAGQD
jgi:5-methylthioribose kinase